MSRGLGEMGDLILAIRSMEGYTQEEFAAVIGVTSSAVKQWENALCSPSKKNYEKIVAYLEKVGDKQALRMIEALRKERLLIFQSRRKK